MTNSYSAEELKAMRARGEGRSDWSKADAISEDELERLIAALAEGEQSGPATPFDFDSFVEVKRTATRG